MQKKTPCETGIYRTEGSGSQCCSMVLRDSQAPRLCHAAEEGVAANTLTPKCTGINPKKHQKQIQSKSEI